MDEINKGCEMSEILRYGGILIVMALLSLLFGAMAGSACATASAGLAKNLRRICIMQFRIILFKTLINSSHHQILRPGGL